MSAWAAFFDAPAARALAGALLEFVWQGAAVASGLAIANLALRARKNAARLRYALACSALAMMVFLPAAGFLRRLAPVPGGEPTRFEVSPATSVIPPAVEGSLPIVFLADESAGRSAAAPFGRILLVAWIFGVAALSIRLLAGWRAAGLLRVRETWPARPEIVAMAERLCRRLRVATPVRVLESGLLRVPAAVGVFRPAVLLPVSSLTGLPVEQIEALLAHELAHIRRHDYLVNLVQSAAETLLFYQPAVWWVSGRIRIERENCCDDLAVAATGDPMVYARALVDLEERRGSGSARALALAANGGELFGRIARLFPEVSDRRHPRRGSRAAGAVGLACLLLVGAAFRVAPFDEDLGEIPSPRTPAALPLPALAPLPARRAPAPLPAGRPAPPVVAVPARAPAAALAPLSPATPAAVASATPAALAPPAVMTSAFPVLPAIAQAFPSEAPDAVVEAVPPTPAAAPAELRLRLRADELAALRSHRVTPGFLREIASLGYTRATTDDLISLKIHGIDPARIAAFQKSFGDLPLSRCIEFGIHGVTPDWISRIESAGISGLTPAQAVSLRIHGVTPEYLEAFRQAGYPTPTADQAASLRIHGVEPGDAAAWPGPRGARPTLDELISARIHGVDARFAENMRAAGFSGAGIEELTSFRIHGVDAAFVRDIKAAGFPSLSADEAVSFRIHAVTPAFVREMRQLGVTSLNAEDVVSLRIHGVTAEFVRSLAAEGYTHLDSDDLTSLRIHAVTVDQIRAWNQGARGRLSIQDLIEARLEKRSSR
ncbi:MAG: M56 family metallopeptidase [Acidobacteriota bacterium]